MESVFGIIWLLLREIGSQRYQDYSSFDLYAITRVNLSVFNDECGIMRDTETLARYRREWSHNLNRI